jgi:hypothetical protein
MSRLPDPRLDSPFAAHAIAQRLAFAPLMFQAARAARDLRVLAAVEPKLGASRADVEQQTGLSAYAVGVLLDACEGLELVERKAQRFHLTAAGSLLLHDEMTRVNMDFSQDVCWRGSEHLQEALLSGRPAGLPELVAAPTIYEALARLPRVAKDSWFRFDHYYSDQVFPLARPVVLSRKPRGLLDVGGNTGRWALKLAAEVPVTILDHPGQLDVALAAAKTLGLEGRVRGAAMDLLDHARAFPEGFDAVWMSQFLCCFGPGDIEQLLRRGAAALSPDGRLYILETFPDRQPNAVARFCLDATSLYFTCMANGTSRMYPTAELLACVERAGLVVEDDLHLGLSHTLLVCRRG